ncbi:MAG: hypothetical protein AAGC76_01970 [Luteibacter sp.]|uniref:hypothetical protein n=1 Tax=Luteibacter sp. TaxID=1886636 RepID=UPI002807337F|nr:hypothetical protein [Luteibacter sp.]MDQ7994600.1 hypothetical protein [Luteibacter sp.]
MTMFWLVLAGALMLFGRFGTHSTKSDGLGGVLFGFSQLAMLGCLGLAFFSLFDRPTSTSFTGPSPWASVGMVGGGLLAIVLAGMALVGVIRHRRMGKDELVTPELTLRLDTAEGVVHLSARGRMETHRMALGRMVVEVSPFETEGAHRARLVFRQWPTAGSLSPETAQRAMATVMELEVYINTAKAIRAWLDRHSGVELDASVVRLQWQQKVDAMLRHARAQLPNGKVVVESFVAYDGPSLDYLAVLADGRMWAGAGEETLLEPVTRPLVSDRSRRVQVSVGNRYPVFTLSHDQIDALRHLRDKGAVMVLDGQF